MKGMTAENTFQGQKETPAYPVFSYRLVSIDRTAWFVSATRGNPGRNGLLIKTEQKENQFFGESRNPDKYH
jgi:hypothetical protein